MASTKDVVSGDLNSIQGHQSSLSTLGTGTLAKHQTPSKSPSSASESPIASSIHSLNQSLSPFMEEDKQVQQSTASSSTLPVTPRLCQNILRAVVLSVPASAGGWPAVLRMLASLGVEVLDHFDPSVEESEDDS